VGDQDGYESVVRDFYDDGWNGILYYNGKGDFYVNEDGEDIIDKGDDDMAVHPVFVKFDGDATELLFNPWAGTLRGVANADEKKALIDLYKLAGVNVPQKALDFGKADAPFGARANDALSRGANFKGFERFEKHPSTRAVVRDENARQTDEILKGLEAVLS
jgi:hypothetical protein